MNPLVAEWLRKAKADLETAERESQVRLAPNYDAVCFHCQQAVEKALKALMISVGERPPKTHDLVMLLTQVSEQIPLMAKYRDACAEMSFYAVEFRYPGEEATEDIAVSAMENARGIWQEIEQLFQNKLSVPKQHETGNSEK